MNLLKKLLVFSLLFTASANAQLANFNLEVSKTDETCPGNASLSFLASNTSAGASIVYKVYLLPDTTTPLATQTQDRLGSLAAGTYKVVAMQFLGSQSNSQVKEITINDNTVPFNFIVSSYNENCSSGATLVITPTSGTAAAYEIISGNSLRPLQSSNVFQNMPPGSYNIRAFDNCGTGKVLTYNLTFENSVLSLSPTLYPDNISPVCDYITVQNKILPVEGVINYPLTIEQSFDVMDMYGNPLTNNQTFSDGPEDELIISTTVPRGEADYGYTMRVTDNCNFVYEKNDIVNPGISLVASLGLADCAEKYLILETSKFASPYTIEFLSSPEGFDPLLLNASLTSQFTEQVVEYGNEENTVPFGHYVIRVTDACGRIVTEEIEVEFIKPVPTIVAHNKGCFAEVGTIKISIPEQKVVSAIITAAPQAYGNVLPSDVTSRIDSSGQFVMRELPIGIYTITIVDDCGYTYEITIEVPPFVEQNFPVKTLPSCDEGFGSLHIKSRNGNLTSIFITAAPASLGQALPYDISENIGSNGEFTMNSLPEGQYVFTATDACGIVKELTVNIQGYQAENSTFLFRPKCGLFHLQVTDLSNIGEGQTYWLQRFDPLTGTWGHPATGEVYTDGTLPTAATGIQLFNFVHKFNIRYAGKFRILKKFEGFGNGTTQNIICYELIGEFTYTEGLDVLSAYTLACTGHPNDVYLEVAGHPIGFKIIEKNGQPFTFYNGTNVFPNLEPAEYTFVVEDDCGNMVTKRFNLIDLPSVADATQPDDMIICAEAFGQEHMSFNLTSQNAGVLGQLHSAMYTITYHLTQEDADNGVNSLPDFYTNASNGQTIYVRLVNNYLSLCHGTTSFRLFVGEYREPQITTTGTLCQNESLSLTASAGYDSYLWSTGETTRTIFVTEPGIYTLLAEKVYGNASCDAYAEVEIIESSAPEIIKVEALDWTYDQNQIIVHTEGIGEYLYSLDGIAYQESNTFTGLENGVYTVFVKDANGCGTDSEEVVLLNYPKFFTPNGDGYHDTWRIKYSTEEPNMKIVIFDRFGKIITNFGANHIGWDGTFNGKNLPATDYWFVVTREDGRELKGHFAMLR